MKSILAACLIGAFFVSLDARVRQDPPGEDFSESDELLAAAAILATIPKGAETLNDAQLDAIVRIYKLDSQARPAAEQLETYLVATRRAGKDVDFARVEEILKPVYESAS